MGTQISIVTCKLNTVVTVIKNCLSLPRISVLTYFRLPCFVEMRFIPIKTVYIKQQNNFSFEFKDSISMFQRNQYPIYDIDFIVLTNSINRPNSDFRFTA